MNRKLGKPLFLAFVAVSFLAGCRPAQTVETGAAIEPVEAIHLVEVQVPKLKTTRVTPAAVDGDGGYVVEGTAGGDTYRAEVRARDARVVRISRNGASYYKWPGIVVVGHRGTVKFAPENTVAAFKKAIELGADLIEIDVRETKDGHLVILHDASVDRTTNGSGPVAEMTLNQVKALDAGSWFAPEFAGEKIPTLEEALETMKGKALPDLDFKAGEPEKLIATVRKFGLLGKVTLYCGSWPLMHRTIELSRDFLIRPTVPFRGAGFGKLLDEFDPPIVNMDWKEFSEPLVRRVHIHGTKAFVNTMGPNDTELAMIQAIEAGADYMQSDHLDVLVPLLRSRGLHR